MTDRLSRLTAAFHAAEDARRRERLFKLCMKAVELRLARGKRTRYEVRRGHWGSVPGDTYKLIHTDLLYVLPSREAAWERAIELSDEGSIDDILIGKPDHLFFNDPEATHPTRWDTPPVSMHGRWHGALKRGRRVASGLTPV